jgi:hypothetical protein
VKHLKISEDLSLPIDAATQTFAFIARKGAGKTYAAGKLAECLMDAAVQVVVLDAVGNWWGLRLLADGKTPAYDIPVIGGLRGDIPLEATSGHLIADVITDSGGSLVIDISQFNLSDRQRFATALGERLWANKKAEKHPSPVHLIIEESQLFVPQMVKGDKAKMVGVYEEIIRLGRNYGIGVSMITQRPQSVNKEVLNMTECLFVLQVNGAQERKSLKDWITYHGVEKGLVDELPTLPIGTAFVWSPQWLQVLQKVKIGRKKTFDASATPKVGSHQVRRDLKPLNLDDLKERMAATIEKAKAEDPKELRKQIAELKKQLTTKTPAPAKPVETIKTVEKLVLKDAQIKRLESFGEKLSTVGIQLVEVAREITVAIGKVSSNGHKPAVTQRPAQAPKALPSRAPARQERTAVEHSGDFKVPSSQQRILNSLAWLESVNLSPVIKKQVALMAGQSPTSGGFFNNLGALRSAGLIDYPSGGMVALTDAGRNLADYTDTPSSSDELQQQVCAMVTSSQATILKELICAYPDAVAKSELAQRVGQSPTSGGYFNNLGRLRSLGMIDYPQSGYAVASPVLFLEETNDAKRTKADTSSP